MLDAFVAVNRDEVVSRTRERVALRASPGPSDVELTDGIPLFLDQLREALRLAESSDRIDHGQIAEAAARHGRELLRRGRTVSQVVHCYGDVCQVITELAVEQGVEIPAKEYRTLNRCLDDAIAEAVSEYARHRETAIERRESEKLGILAHEMRNLLHSASLTFDSIKAGLVSQMGSTGVALGRSLVRLQDLVARSLADVRLEAGIERRDLIPVAELLEEVEVGAAVEANERGQRLVVTTVERDVAIEGDRQILAAALANLLQNAFKFSREHGTVTVTTRVSVDRVLFEVEDECGGLPPGRSEQLFQPFEQRGGDRSGVGLGLAICRKAAHANHGTLDVRDLPGKGCVFMLDLPRKSVPVSILERRERNIGPRPA